MNDLSAKHKRKINESTDEEDSDLLFLKSLLPYMKNLNDAQKRRYKQRILGLYDEIINEQCVPIPVYSPAISNYSSVSSASSQFNEANNQARNIYQTDNLSSYASLVSDAINSDSVHD
ncbi:hypothetical protein JTB14_018951 [Gonioctena quinquepunctata]|nr:hypothetical protein JTB14_018951 [Gonioctena quinquepunctata]